MKPRQTFNIEIQFKKDRREKSKSNMGPNTGYERNKRRINRAYFNHRGFFLARDFFLGHEIFSDNYWRTRQTAGRGKCCEPNIGLRRREEKDS